MKEGVSWTDDTPSSGNLLSVKDLIKRIVIVCYFNGAIMPPKVSEFNGSASVFFCVNMYSCHIFW